MRTEKVFKIAWDKGHMELKVGKYFGNSNQNDIKKMFRLIMRKYCTEEQRSELIQLIQGEIKLRECALKDIELLEGQINLKLYEFGVCPVNLLNSAARKDLQKQCERMKKAINLLNKERW